MALRGDACLTLAGRPASLFDSEKRATVVELWHRRCERCPRALADAERLAQRPWTASARFVACALSTDARADDDERARAAELVEEGGFEHLEHVFMTFEQKEEAKRAFGIAVVPHCVVLAGEAGEAGEAVVYTGPPPDESTLRALLEGERTPVSANRCSDGSS